MWRSIDDFTDEDISWILSRAAEHRAGSTPLVARGPIVGLLFLETSLRTKVGFSAAAARLGGTPLPVLEQRQSEISMAESVPHTLRTLSGYCDVVVTRVGEPLMPLVPAELGCPILSGGDRGPEAEHPSQALIDLFALRNEFGPTEGLEVTVVGDPRMRSVSSLCRLLLRTGVRRIRILTVDGLRTGWNPPPDRQGRVSMVTGWSDTCSADLIYMAGIPHAIIPVEERDSLCLTREALEHVSSTCVVTSPLPVIDEIAPDAWEDPRVRAFEHSDDGIFVRMALLEFALRSETDQRVPGGA